MTKSPTYIDKQVLGRKLTESFIRECLKNGMSEPDIKKAFTVDKLNEMTDDFCSKYNFTVEAND